MLHTLEMHKIVVLQEPGRLSTAVAADVGKRCASGCNEAATTKAAAPFATILQSLSLGK